MTLVKRERGPRRSFTSGVYLDHNERSGKRLGRMLARRGLEAGGIWSFVPPDTSPETLADLAQGALYADTPIVADELGHRWQRKHDPGRTRGS